MQRHFAVACLCVVQGVFGGEFDSVSGCVSAVCVVSCVCHRYEQLYECWAAAGVTQVLNAFESTLLGQGFCMTRCLKQRFMLGRG